jgi:serine acetyltransferase
MSEYAHRITGTQEFTFHTDHATGIVIGETADWKNVKIYQERSERIKTWKMKKGMKKAFVFMLMQRFWTTVIGRKKKGNAWVTKSIHQINTTTTEVKIKEIKPQNILDLIETPLVESVNLVKK